MLSYMPYIRCPPHILQTFTTMLARTNASQHPAWNPDEQQLPVVRHSIIGNVLTHQ